jgi:predicted Zn-dependent protease
MAPPLQTKEGIKFTGPYHEAIPAKMRATWNSQIAVNQELFLKAVTEARHSVASHKNGHVKNRHALRKA